MTTFSNVVRDRAPAHTFVLPRSAWSETYKKRPGCDMAIGLRILSEDEIQRARAEAAKGAVELYRTAETVDELARLEAYNDACIRWVAGMACCSPNDIDESFFEHQEDTVRRGLTSDGAKRIFDEYERLRAETSPTTEVASDDDIDDLCVRLFDGDDSLLSEVRKLRCRRLLRGVLDELRSVSPPVDDDDDDLGVLEGSLA